MRILLVTDWTAEEGGIETYLELVAGGLRAAGDEVALLTSSAGPGAHADYRAFGTDRVAAQAFLQIANPLAALDLRRAVADFRPDAVYVSMFEIFLSPAIFAPLRRTRTVLNIAYYKPVCPTGHKLLPDGAICQVRAGDALPAKPLSLAAALAAGAATVRADPRCDRERGRRRHLQPVHAVG
ncbi:MAG: glycosyltransferase, partial [Gaiellaceae bacterium]